MDWLSKILVLLVAVKAQFVSEAYLCRLSVYDDLVCFSSKGSNHEALISECCLLASRFRQTTDLCPYHLNLRSLYDEVFYLHICPDSSRINILSNSLNHLSRSLFIQCTSVSDVYNLNIYSASELPFPVILSKRYRDETITNFSKYTHQPYSSGYKYTATTSTIRNLQTLYQAITLKLGPLNRRCYGNTTLSGTVRTNDYYTNTITLTGVSNISCSYLGYYLPEQNENIAVSVQMDANISISIGESIDSASPNKACISGEICSFSVNMITGRVYQVYITATKAGSNTINVTSFIISNTQFLYHQTAAESFSKVKCISYLSYKLNKVFNGVYLCPIEYYKCNVKNSESRYYSALIPKYCSNYSWISDTFTCTSCIQNSHIENGLCVCDFGYAENHRSGECLATSYKVEINLYRVILIQTAIDASHFDTALLIITNPCTQVDNNFFCKETGSSSLLYKAIIIEFTPKDDLILSASAFLLESSYSITINYLKSGGLVRECWSGWEYKGYRSRSDIGDISIPAGMNVCVYEGYLKAPDSNLEIFVKANDMSCIWIGDYSNIFNFIINTSSVFTYTFTKDKLYYIRIEFYNTVGAAIFKFQWRSMGETTFKDFSSDILYYPTRPLWNIKHLSSLEDTLHIPNNSIDEGVNYCPYECSSCKLNFNGEYECLSCRNNLILVDGECICEGSIGFDSVNYECIVCPELSMSCSYEDNEIKELECIDNAFRYFNSCICNENYYALSNICTKLDCSLSLSMINNDMDDIILLDIIMYCDVADCEMGGFRRTDRYEDGMSVKSDAEYSLSIHKLEPGYLEFKYWESDSDDGFPDILKKAALDQDLSTYISGKARYQGYFTLAVTGEYRLTIETNAVFTIYISDDSMITYQTSSNNFSKYFSENKFYFIRIDIVLTENTYFKILTTHEGSNFELSLYYPNTTKNSPISISSCKASFVFEYKDENTDIQFCPNLCKECIQMISKYDETQASNICIECFEYSELIYDRCECIDGYSFNPVTRSCYRYNQCDLDDFYMQDDDCIPKIFDVNLSSQVNAIIIQFNKTLLQDFKIEDFTIVLVENIDTRLFTYNLATIENRREYFIEFTFIINIEKTFNLSIIFSNQVTDRQQQILSPNIRNITLPIFNDGIIIRSELCPISCKECEFINGNIVCSICYDYAYMIDGECKCYSKESTDPLTCLDRCPEGMKVYPDSKTCLPCGDCIEININNQTIIEEDISYMGITKEDSENISTASTTSTSIIALISLLIADKLWSLVNTIQIYTYIPLLQVNMPKYLRDNLKSQDTLKELMNTFRGSFKNGKKPFSNAVEFGYDTAYLPYNTAKPIFIFLPSESSVQEIIVYDINLILLISLMVILYFLIVFICFNYRNFNDEALSSRWSILYDEFQTPYKISTSLYYPIFFIRRLFISISLILLRNYPIAQVIVCSVSCLIVLLYISIYRPYNTRAMNVMQILNEMNISMSYCLSGSLYFDTGIDIKVPSWSILACVFFSYMIHLAVIMLDLCKLIIKICKKYNIKQRLRNLSGRFFNRTPRTNSHDNHDK